ncbi:hypothetical protein LTS08_006071 [Lithohypha guttulata]|uniref:uncharacterized protein n=1 Tax=Lithohypha guttulata TaxID=1690604 RepID=UPI002DE0C58E|nr:hypothetical protein LTR51_002928 [Lithohypha guttulata]KAK5098693.1 hypothetical protein LTS08_006071 [Lithohypha guttulata]
MPPAGNGPGYVCLPCLLRSTRTQTPHRSLRLDKSLQQTPKSAIHSSVSLRRQARAAQDGHNPHDAASTLASKPAAEPPAPVSVELSSAERSKIGRFHEFRVRLQEQLDASAKIASNRDDSPLGAMIEKVLAHTEDDGLRTFTSAAGKHYSEVPTRAFIQDLDRITPHRRPSAKLVDNADTIVMLKNLGVLQEGIPKEKTTASKSKGPVSKDKSTLQTDNASSNPTAEAKKTARKARRTARARVKARKVPSSAKPVRLAARKPLMVASNNAPGKKTPSKDVAMERYASSKAATVQPPTDARSIDSSFVRYKAVDVEAAAQVPKLSFDLSRVLFNPGVYHLQDPRSRVYNFDPYLENIMPITEFNFDALNPYVTSSQDTTLRDVSMKHQKRYIGSSSSMSGAMSQFHFLLSAWRPINFSILSQRFMGHLSSFTTITRAPASIFLRWRDGVYAVDADKEHDSPNILMMQGKSMEKLLTLEKNEFEKYRKPKAGQDAPAIDTEPEVYHYSTTDKFLLRSQLDAYDPRLPGTGTFDLKTRSVAGVRMLMHEHESGMNYEIKDRFGMWESFDREYYDMIRSAFLKYSMQVRMGRMDGIFVAYHNIARIFGFQYISLPEMDMALHGQADTVLGDREFLVTLKLMGEIFDAAVQVFPEQSLRMTFDTKEPVNDQSAIYMRIFVEPMPEDVIEKTQKSSKVKLDAYEKAMAQGLKLDKSAPSPSRTLEEVFASGQSSPSTLESNAADIGFLDSILGTRAPDGEKPEAQGKTQGNNQAKVEAAPVIGYELHIWNEVNGKNVLRPTDITSEDRWTVKYKLDRMDNNTTRANSNRSRTKRAQALGRDDKEGYFQRMIRQLNESGREWRAEQDQLDGQREKVTLYNN